MEKAFDQGRRYERTEVVEMLKQIQTMPTEQFPILLKTWEQELTESLIPVIEIQETYVIT